MSIASRQRHQKQPSPESGRPRQRNARPSEKPLNITQFQDIAHKANVASRTKKLAGAFGSVECAARAAKRNARIEARIEAQKAATAI